MPTRTVELPQAEERRPKGVLAKAVHAPDVGPGDEAHPGLGVGSHEQMLGPGEHAGIERQLPDYGSGMNRALNALGYTD